MDKTVRLWHVSRVECLCAFKHSDFVTSIQFHPRDDRFFLAGSLDSKLRLWSIPDKSVAFWNQLPDMITAVSFTPDGKFAIAGCLSGLCMFYETEGLKYQTQIHVKSAHGKNARGSKITGIQATNIPPGDPTGDVKLLITSNDSRIRLYNFRDKGLDMKFKGNENTSSQIHARFSDDARYIICGSEDKKVFIWTNQQMDAERRDKHALEVFEGSSFMATASTMAPVKTRQLLSASEDPVYDVCNPPPVTLMSRSEVGSVVSLSRGGNGDAASTTHSTTAAHTAHDTASQAAVKRAEHSAGYISRTVHPNGNVIITADSAGVIKVFRQDCAHGKRRQAALAAAAADSWETSSLFSRRRGPGGSIGHSIGAARRSSLAPTAASGRSRAGSNVTQPPGERILSWRQTIAPSASADRLPTAGTAAAARHDRSVSPRKPSSAWARTSRPSSITPSHTGPATPAAAAPSNDAAQYSSDEAVPPLPHRPAFGADSHLANLRPLQRPEAERTSSYIYYRRDAWKDAFGEQARHVGEQIAADRNALSTHGRAHVPIRGEASSSVSPSPSRGGAGGHEGLAPPLGAAVLGLQASARSSRSVLTSEASSEVGEGGGIGGRGKDGCAATAGGGSGAARA